MRLRIIELGMAKMTGHVGSVMVTDGVTEDINQREADCLAGMMRCEVVDESGELNTEYDTHANTNAPNVGSNYDPNRPDTIETNEGETDEDDVDAKFSAKSAKPAKEVSVETLDELEELPSGHYSREQLAKIADEKGIQGLRDIALPYDIRGTSISGLIEAILGRQSGV